MLVCIIDGYVVRSLSVRYLCFYVKESPCYPECFTMKLFNVTSNTRITFSVYSIPLNLKRYHRLLNPKFQSNQSNVAVAQKQQET
ncbi:hypothetical protein FGO68_gene17169 [Halteria grandinella]|uniref:Uncharacterized protein n=1 Tax=Halteria grandinella TaxID=5974 RepID=A0A8J8T8K1_HALGN|nr:hypothetical protein FGO68_gene17169 [Halteria grandinella]